MCLGIPGRVIEITPDARHPYFTEGKIDFGGVVRAVCLAYVPEVEVGEYVIVHAGFAIARIDAEAARRIFDDLRQAGQLEELEAAGEGCP